MSLRPNSKLETRRNMYKVSLDAEEGRRRREDDMVMIRKNKREENLQKKRHEGFLTMQSPQPGQLDFLANIIVLQELKNLPAMVASVWSNDRNAQLEATARFRKMLSTGHTTPIDEVVKSGVVPRFIEFLSRDDFIELQIEAGWALTNIASGTSANTKAVIDHGAIPVLVRLLSSPVDEVREQAFWALGNIASDSPKFRDLVLADGALIPLPALFNEHTKLSTWRSATWMLSNLLRGKPKPSFSQTRAALPTLVRLIHSNDKEVLKQACWALSYHLGGDHDRIDAVVDSGIGPRLVELLLHPCPTVVIPALRTLGNIVTGNDTHTQYVINHQGLPFILNILTNDHKSSIKKEACWTISNITAGTVDQIQAIMEAGIIAPLVNLLKNGEFEVKKEAVWAISNASCGGTREQIKFLVTEGCMEPLCKLLTCPDPEIITVCLDGLESILKAGEAEKIQGNTDGNLYSQLMEEVGGLETLVELQLHDNNDIYEKAVKILQIFWGEEDDEELEINDSQDESAIPIIRLPIFLNPT